MGSERADEIYRAFAGRLRLDGLTLTVAPVGVTLFDVTLSDGDHYAGIQFNAEIYSLNPKEYLAERCYRLVTGYALQRFMQRS